MKNLIKLVGVLGLLCTSHVWAYAICSRVTTSVNLTGTTLFVQRDTKMGEPLNDIIPPSAMQLIYTCPATPIYAGVWQNFGFKATGSFTGLTSGNRYIYASTYPGVGFALGASQGDGVSVYWLPATSTPLDGNINQLAMIAASGGNMATSRGSARVRLYKTGTITSGVLSGRVGVFILGSSEAGSGGWAAETPINISGLTITVLACTLSTPSVAVPLGDVQANQFSGVGSTLGTRNFNLGLNCDAGTRVNVSMSGVQNTDTSNTSVLALTGAGNADVAKGVGAQILYNNTPMNIGENLLLKTSAGGMETLGFQARYYQTLAKVMPGKANATATLNISYE
ncbi:fimbrial protein [Edaphovirga cremea]|uniref:fimbrial protein n=1 Tax=Edaphovirga cremea TaxID=2267246 RepID=UPI003989FC45